MRKFDFIRADRSSVPFAPTVHRIVVGKDEVTGDRVINLKNEAGQTYFAVNSSEPHWAVNAGALIAFLRG